MTRLAIRPAFHFSSELDRLFSERPSRKYNWSPSVDTHEAKEAFVVTMELPGVSSEDVSIRLDDDTLTIAGEKKEVLDKSESKGRYHFERSFGSFARSFRLPKAVDAEAINASYKEGVLTVTLPKSETSLPREISVNVG